MKQQHIIFAFGTNSLLLQKVAANADVMATKGSKRIENSYERQICSFGFILNIFLFQRAKLSSSLNATKQKMLHSCKIMSNSKGRALANNVGFHYY